MIEEPVKTEESWETVAALMGEGQNQAVADFIESLPHDELPRLVSRLDQAECGALMEVLPASQAADVLEELPEAQAAEIMSHMAAGAAAEIVEEMAVEEQAELLRELGERRAEAILNELDVEESTNLRERIDYHPESAGALMSGTFLSFSEHMTVGGLLRDLDDHADRYSDLEVQYAYVTAGDGGLTGVLPLRDLVLTPRGTKLEQVMIRGPVSVAAAAPLEDTSALFDHYDFVGVPVVDGNRRLVGVLSRDAVSEAMEKRSRKTFLKISGIVGGEELRSLPLKSRAIRRLAFLCPNIILNVVAASVIALYQDTLEAVIALAVFLPIVSDMSGCSGNQAVAVSIRELALRLIRPSDALRVFLKEGALGLINGVVVGTLLGAVAFLWKDNIYLGLVVGGALTLNTLVSVLLGGLVPLLLRALRIDPALASGPILTTVTDMCGFFFVLSFANLALDKIVD